MASGGLISTACKVMNNNYTDNSSEVQECHKPNEVFHFYIRSVVSIMIKYIIGVYMYLN